MSRYIDVSEDAIKSIFKKLNHRNVYPKSSDEMILRNYLDEFPTADVVEVVRGEWKVSELGYPYCSKCGTALTKSAPRTNYCSNCGADMRGGHYEQIH